MTATLLYKRMGLGALLGLGAGFVASQFAPKIYEARAELVLMSSGTVHSVTALGSPLETQLSLLRSEGVYREAYRAALRKNEGNTRSPQPVQPSLGTYKLYQVEANPNSGVAVVRVRAYDPIFAAALANQIGLIYQVTRAKADDAVDKAQRKSLISRAEKAKADLDDAEGKLQAYKQSTGSPDLTQTTQQTLSYQATLQQRLNDARSEYQQTGIALATIRSNMRTIPKTIRDQMEQAPDSGVVALNAKLNELQGQRVDALRTFTETSSRVRAIDEQIKDVQRQIAAAGNKPWVTNGFKVNMNPEYQRIAGQYNDTLAHYNSLTAEISNLQRNLADVQAQVARLPEAQHEMQQLQRSYDFALGKYNSLQTQLTEKMQDAAGDSGEVPILTATPDMHPVSPNVPLLLLLGSGLGMVGGVLYTLATRKDERSVRTADDLERLTGLEAGAVMALPKRKSDAALKALPQSSTRPSEAYRFMALTMPPSEGAKKILFTGVGKDAGCSSAAGQFALALACEGRSTMLVDCDFRSSSLTHVFGWEQKPGLSDILRKTLLPSQDNDVSFSTQHENLLFLPSGSQGDGSIADFPQSQLKAALETLTERAEIIIFDAAPCDVVTDAVRLCPLVDEVYLIVSAEDTESAKVNMAHRMLQRCGAKEVRVMLTGSDPKMAPFSAA